MQIYLDTKHVCLTVVRCAEYANIHSAIDSVLKRCAHVTQHFSPVPQHQSRPHSPTYITMRSRLLFTQPQQTEDSTPQSDHQQQQQQQQNQESSTGSVTGLLSQPQQMHSVQSQNTPAARHVGLDPQNSPPASRWQGSPVDLNPGFSFRPGGGRGAYTGLMLPDI